MHRSQRIRADRALLGPIGYRIVKSRRKSEILLTYTPAKGYRVFGLFNVTCIIGLYGSSRADAGGKGFAAAGAGFGDQALRSDSEIRCRRRVPWTGSERWSSGWLPWVRQFSCWVYASRCDSSRWSLDSRSACWACSDSISARWAAISASFSSLSSWRAAIATTERPL
jgi:hypothetical protein